MKKSNFKKIALISLGLMASLPLYPTTAAVVGGTLGAAAAVGIVAYGVHKHHKNKEERRNCNQCNKSGKNYTNQKPQSKKEMKSDKKMYESKLKEHKRDLQKLHKPETSV